jgi:Fe-S cluster assembly protein SufD
MAIESFLKVDKSDPDWSFSPSQYYGKQFKVIDANCIMTHEGTEDEMVLRLTPSENELLCKNLQVVARQESKLSLFITCDGSENTQQVFLYNVTAEPNSIINIGVFVKNGKLNKHIFECEVYENADINIIGLSENNEGGSSEIIAKVYHMAPNSMSQQWVNCTSGNNGRTVFQGSVVIEEEMEDCKTAVINSNIITDKTGQAYSIPQLMIGCGKVEASHSCDIGKFDEESIWYLRSRGISEEDAKTMLIHSHQDRILNFLTNTDIQDELKEFFRN